MVGQRRWVLFGAILTLVGLAQIVWSNIRQSSTPTMQDTKP
jgi:hypothetical protein